MIIRVTTFLLALTTLSACVLADQIQTYTITEQNDTLTTDIPDAQVTGIPDSWTIILAAGWSVGAGFNLTVPEPDGEPGVNVIVGFNRFIQVTSDVIPDLIALTASTLGSITDPNGIVHPLDFQDLSDTPPTSAVPDTASTGWSLLTALVGCFGISRLRYLRAV